MSYSDIPHLKPNRTVRAMTLISNFLELGKYINNDTTMETEQKTELQCRELQSNCRQSLNENLSQKYINIIFLNIFTSFLVKKGVKLKTGFSIRCRYSIRVAVKKKLLNETSE